MLKSIYKNKKSFISLIFILFVIIGAILIPHFFPKKSLKIDFANSFRPPVFAGGTRQFVLGTDLLGRDLFFRIMHGARYSLLIACGTVLFAASLGTVIGLVSGYAGGSIDNVIMRAVDIQLSLPPILIAMLMISILEPGIINLIIALAVSGWADYARIIRGATLSVKENDYIESARAIGCPTVRILFLYVLPQVMPLLIVIATQQIGYFIMFESALSFLGLGVQPPTPSWGVIIADGRSHLSSAWWISTLPGVLLSITVLAFFYLGDWLREVLDPMRVRRK
jgi:peptide/nickel transport system permease protein